MSKSVRKRKRKRGEPGNATSQRVIAFSGLIPHNLHLNPQENISKYRGSDAGLDIIIKGPEANTSKAPPRVWTFLETKTKVDTGTDLILRKVQPCVFTINNHNYTL